MMGMEEWWRVGEEIGVNSQRFRLGTQRCKGLEEGVKGAGLDARVGFDGVGGFVVVFFPLQPAAWFCWVVVDGL